MSSSRKNFVMKWFKLKIVVLGITVLFCSTDSIGKLNQNKFVKAVFHIIIM